MKKYIDKVIKPSKVAITPRTRKVDTAKRRAGNDEVVLGRNNIVIGVDPGVSSPGLAFVWFYEGVVKQEWVYTPKDVESTGTFLLEAMDSLEFTGEDPKVFFASELSIFSKGRLAIWGMGRSVGELYAVVATILGGVSAEVRYTASRWRKLAGYPSQEAYKASRAIAMDARYVDTPDQYDALNIAIAFLNENAVGVRKAGPHVEK